MSTESVPEAWIVHPSEDDDANKIRLSTLSCMTAISFFAFLQVLTVVLAVCVHVCGKCGLQEKRVIFCGKESQEQWVFLRLQGGSDAPVTLLSGGAMPDHRMLLVMKEV